jgi:hypothetical protein
MIKKLWGGVFLIALTSCHRDQFVDSSSQSIVPIACLHKDKLRRHFLGENVGDISTLIAETIGISNELKRAGLTRGARSFDSYVDVLMFGNHTLDESINDVISLVRAQARKIGN